VDVLSRGAVPGDAKISTSLPGPMSWVTVGGEEMEFHQRGESKKETEAPMVKPQKTRANTAVQQFF